MSEAPDGILIEKKNKTAWPPSQHTTQHINNTAAMSDNNEISGANTARNERDAWTHSGRQFASP